MRTLANTGKLKASPPAVYRSYTPKNYHGFPSFATAVYFADDKTNFGDVAQVILRIMQPPPKSRIDSVSHLLYAHELRARFEMRSCELSAI